MKTNRKWKKMAAFLAALILTALCLCQAVFAADTAGIDLARLASLHIDLKEIGTTSTDRAATIAVYLVGEWDGTKGQYALTDRFSGSGADVSSLTTAEEVLAASEALDEYALAQGLTADAVQTTSNGEADFTGLSTGLYLVCQRRGSSDNVTISPFLTTLPVLDEESNTWNYAVSCYPKSQADAADETDPGDDGGTETEESSASGGSGSVSSSGSSSGGSSGGSGGSSGGGSSSSGRSRSDLTSSGTTTVADGGSTSEAGSAGGDEEDPILMEPEDIPLFALPKTGDDSATYGMLIGLMVLAAVGGVLMLKKRRSAAE